MVKISLNHLELFCRFLGGGVFLEPHPFPGGGSLVRDQIGTIAAGLHHSHSSAGSEPHL